MTSPIDLSKLRIALAHDYLSDWGGGERVLLSFKQKLAPAADVFAITCDAEQVKEEFPYPVKTSRLQNLPLGYKKHKWYLPFMPWAVDSLDFRGYDLIVSDSSGFIKGLTAPKGSLHVCYLHTPTRYLTFKQEYFHDTVPKFLHPIMPMVLRRLKKRDLVDAKAPHVVIANSHQTAERCLEHYGRQPDAVIFPPVNMGGFSRRPTDGKQDYYLVAGRMAPYKRCDLAIAACLQLGRRLVVVGTGVEEENLRAQAAGNPLIEFKGRVSDEDLRRYYAEAKAMIFPPHEDAGITPLESMACGTPVIAFGKGGVLESVVEGKTGVFFPEQTPEAVAEAILRFEGMSFSEQVCIEHAAEFTEDRFIEKVRAVIEDAVRNRPELLAKASD